ncbi:OmpA family protein [Vibrio sp. CAU 1672]|uniref:OmpA family protein n=1 Tax=Vibrio sp. CAU 1672 TaxID=3032594 RepID=UPI0023DBA9DD|nr:OmpA family protein [Vibrio sp. CAU 1672]MDF2152243.1 OmpA family protein [Vibrio sp. CAU 1672]
MKVIMTVVFALVLAACSSSSRHGDEYDYLPTPIADQSADHMDEDRDGVINARDLCPGTPIGSELDNDGCGEYVKSSEKMQLRVLFANDSDVIKPIFAQQIKELSEFLKQYPSTSIELQGFASIIGAEEYNLDLSKRRAENVRKALLYHGIAPDRIRIVGFGETKLASLGTDEVSHALNRRVTATVVGYKGEAKKEWSIFTTLPKS